MKHIIEVTGLKKAYGDVKAVKGINFYMEEGSLFAFLGPNGAGKSTTIDMITTFLKADEGTVLIDSLTLGKEDDQIRNRIGAVFQDSLLDGNLSIEENLHTRGSLYGMNGKKLREAVDHVLELCELTSLKHRRYGKLSGGQRRRCDIARALLHTPKLLFLDEPTTGLDPQTRKLLWSVIRSLQKEKGMSVFLTTHYMEEAAEADYVVVIDNGEISAQGTPIELKVRFAYDVLRLTPTHVETLCELLDKQQIIYKQVSTTIEIALKDTLSSLPILDVCKAYIDGFEVVHGTMDDAFIQIIGKDIKE